MTDAQKTAYTSIYREALAVCGALTEKHTRQMTLMLEELPSEEKEGFFLAIVDDAIIAGTDVSPGRLCYSFIEKCKFYEDAEFRRAIDFSGNTFAEILEMCDFQTHFPVVYAFKSRRLDELMNGETNPITFKQIFKKCNIDRSCCAPECKRVGKNLTRMKCSACKLSYYCSAECQRDDWPAHKVYCKMNVTFARGDRSALLNRFSENQ